MSKEQLHKLVEELPSDLEDTVQRFLEFLTKDLYDEEPITPDEVDAILESEKDVAEGKTVTFSELKEGKRTYGTRDNRAVVVRIRHRQDVYQK
jgi:hypothetical protein